MKTAHNYQWQYFSSAVFKHAFSTNKHLLLLSFKGKGGRKMTDIKILHLNS